MIATLGLAAPAVVDAELVALWLQPQGLQPARLPGPRHARGGQHQQRDDGGDDPASHTASSRKSGESARWTRRPGIVFTTVSAG